MIQHLFIVFFHLLNLWLLFKYIKIYKISTKVGFGEKYLLKSVLATEISRYGNTYLDSVTSRGFWQHFCNKNVLLMGLTDLGRIQFLF